jgi:hypothetical protein
MICTENFLSVGENNDIFGKFFVCPNICFEKFSYGRPPILGKNIN